MKRIRSADQNNRGFKLLQQYTRVFNLCIRNPFLETSQLNVFVGEIVPAAVGAGRGRGWGWGRDGDGDDACYHTASSCFALLVMAALFLIFYRLKCAQPRVGVWAHESFSDDFSRACGRIGPYVQEDRCECCATVTGTSWNNTRATWLLLIPFD